MFMRTHIFLTIGLDDHIFGTKLLLQRVQWLITNITVQVHIARIGHIMIQGDIKKYSIMALDIFFIKSIWYLKNVDYNVSANEPHKTAQSLHNIFSDFHAEGLDKKNWSN